MDLVARLLAGSMASIPFEVREGDGRPRLVGKGAPRFSLHLKTPAGRRALASMDELAICEAYIRGDLDFEGDMVAALSTRQALTDRRPWIRMWRALQPLVLGRVRCNRAWIAKHYDSANLQLLAVDDAYRIYTPGLFECDEETIESAAARKLQFAFDWLKLRAGQRVLDIGCGWGGFLQFCAERGARATGLTLSKDQFEHDRKLIADRGLDSRVLYQDFFTYQPEEPYDAVSIMGVMEHLPRYEAVLIKLRELVRPGGRAYFDFSAGHVHDDTSSFITKHIWPGHFRSVFMPELFAAISRSPFEVVELWNDRHNYYVWALKVHDKWVAHKEEVVRLAGEEIWRMWRLLFAGVADVMSPSRQACTAYRIVLERRFTD